MTILDAWNLYRTLVDEGSDSFLSGPRFAQRYTQARRAWLKAKAQEVETEYIKRITAAFRAPVLNVNSGIADGIELLGLGETVFIRAVTASFAPKGGKALQNKACTPTSDDAFGVVSSDPTRRGTDWFPRYKEDDGRIFIQSNTVPVLVSIRYLTDLETPTLTQDTVSGLFESPLAVDEIINRVAGRQDLSTENTSRYGATTSREIPQNELNT